MAGWVNAHDHSQDPYDKRFIRHPILLSYEKQKALQQGAAWQQFISRHGSWKASFNELTGLPRLASGKPVRGIVSSDPRHIADAFLRQELNVFPLPYAEIKLRSVVPNKKYYYVHYKQEHKGLEVLWSRGHVAITKDGRIVHFSLDFRNNIQVNIQPTLSRQQAEQAAWADMSITIKQSRSESELKILPVPGSQRYQYHLVYAVYVDAINEEGFPAQYYTLVDAHDGEVLYRHNRITQFCSHPATTTTVTVNATVYPNNPINPTAVMPLKHLRVEVGNTIHYTDVNGQLTLPNTTPVSATLPLYGRWARVYTNNTTPSVTLTLNPGLNTVNYDNTANIRELTAYWAVQEIHDYFKMIATGSPAENVMDFVMTTNVDVAGSCNAFYAGTSINFYAQGNNCNATSLLADVVYHEYGHGINYEVYDAYGGTWSNGAMGEGYADLWANAITENPVLGLGFFLNNPAGYVRRYDINPKVYPRDLVGQVHADGEIIAGAWWDTGINFGSQQDRQILLWETYAALCDAPNGDEGFLFEQILMAALMADDNDGDLTNGTPRYCAITAAFARHGIFEGGMIADLTHTEILSASSQSAIPVQVATLSLIANTQVTAFYKSGGMGSWLQVSLTPSGPMTYSGFIPPQPSGSIVHYYIDYIYSCNPFNVSIGMKPHRTVDPTDPNIPYYVLIDHTLMHSDYLENPLGWVLGDPSDSATTGHWIIDDPIPTYLSGTSGMVQPDFDHTPPPGVKCAVTGNAPPGTSVGNNDVDGGKTTLYSPVYDLTPYQNPVFTYWRWYTNDQGAAPGTDYWQVAISSDGGNTWVPIEHTRLSDHSWRRFAFRVANYVAPTANVRLRFIAEDAGPGSLVEALVDDLELWDGQPLTVMDQPGIHSLYVFPVPAHQLLHLKWSMSLPEEITITLTDMTGRKLKEIIHSGKAGINHREIKLNDVAPGIYLIHLKGNQTALSRPILTR
jgi:Zn-dependent metalloprotease